METYDYFPATVTPVLLSFRPTMKTGMHAPSVIMPSWPAADGQQHRCQSTDVPCVRHQSPHGSSNATVNRSWCSAISRMPHTVRGYGQYIFHTYRSHACARGTSM